MTAGTLRRRLTAQDAAYLHFERPEAPLHIGSVAILEGDVSYDRFAETLSSRLHLIPRYLQRPVSPPLHVGLPTWEFDPEFEIGKHVHAVRLAPPGSQEELNELVSQLFARPLHLDRPLWETYVVRGLEGPRSAILSKVHHSLVDGVSGIGLLMLIFDLTPDPPPHPPSELPAAPPLPTRSDLFWDAVWDGLHDGVDRWADCQRALLALMFRRNEGRGAAVLSALRSTARSLITPAPRAPFNRPPTAGRRVAFSEYAFAEIRAMRRAAGATVNDVVLAMVAGGLERYLRLHKSPLAEASIRAMLPVSTRREEEQGAMGNLVSMLLLDLPLGVHDPVDRIHLISARTREMKDARVAEGVARLANALSIVPAPVQACLGRAALPPNPLFNLVCTNVPGPMVPLYAAGHRMLAHYPLVPLGWDLGLACGVTSYDQHLYFGLMADAQAMPDVALLRDLIDDSYIELREAVGVSPAEIHEVGVRTPAGPPAP